MGNVSFNINLDVPDWGLWLLVLACVMIIISSALKIYAATLDLKSDMRGRKARRQHGRD